MRKCKDITGQKFGRLTAIKFSYRNKYRNAYWTCKCDCGVVKDVIMSMLTGGKVVSCGCYARELTIKRNIANNTTHGLSKHPIYKVWADIITRCTSPKCKKFKNYGGRGITICPEWINDFKTFYNDMVEGYKKGLQIDREDNDGNYCKENCRWVTPKQNCRNTRINKSVIGTSIKTGETKFYQYITDVDLDGFIYQNVGKCCRGERNHHKHWTWEYC